MQFDESTSTTDISGKTKSDKTFKKYNITHFENKLVFKNVLRPHLKYHDYNDYTTLLFDLSPINFDMVRF